MGRNYTWTAAVNGRNVATGDASGTNTYTPEDVERDAATKVGIEARVPASAVTVTVVEKKSNRQQVAEARAARQGK
ncbi:hypothetical protein ABZX77_17860 [Streptomyces sp. NPDC004237]|uniref:hypothetical protein n=1 Tax=Streptomyces sp. NPDC004237 TaxID=3154455 RepID=UPI0033AAEA6E